MLDDGKAKSRAFDVLQRLGIVDAIEPFEDTRQVFFLDSDSGIGDGDIAIPRIHLDRYHAVWLVVLDGIVDEVGEDFLDIAAVGMDMVFLKLQVDGDMVFQYLGLHVLQNGLDKGGDLDIRGLGLRSVFKP